MKDSKQPRFGKARALARACDYVAGGTEWGRRRWDSAAPTTEEEASLGKARAWDRAVDHGWNGAVEWGRRASGDQKEFRNTTAAVCKHRALMRACDYSTRTAKGGLADWGWLMWDVCKGLLGSK